MSATRSQNEERSLFWNRRLNTQLILAICADDKGDEKKRKLYLEKVESLINSGANVNTRCKESLLTVCHMAVCYGRIEILELLLERGANPKLRDKKGLQPHHMIAYHYKFQSSVKCLDIILNKDRTLINSPIEQPDPDVIKNQLAEDELDSFVHDHQLTTTLVPESVTEGSTVLFVASKRSLRVLVEELLKRNADVNKAAEGNLTPLDVTGLEEGTLITGYSQRSTTISKISVQSDAIGQMLISNKGKPTENTLPMAVARGNISIVTNCLETVSPGSLDPTLMHLAIKNGYKNQENKESYNIILEKILEKDSSSINVQNDDGKTPIFLAVEDGWVEDVELLVEKGADITIHSNSGENIIHLVGKQGNYELLAALINIIAPEVTEQLINSTDDEGYSPLFRAVEANRFQCIKMFLTFPCRKRYVVNSGGKSTLLHSAVNAMSDNDLEIIKAIVNYFKLNNKYNLDYFNELNSEGLTALELAASLGHKNCMEFLLSFKEIRSHFLSMINVSRHGTALHLAAKSGHHKTVEYLLDNYPILISGLDSEHRTALIVAALRGHEKCVFTLLSKGANLADKDTSLNRTALDIIMNYIPSPVQMIDDLLSSFTGEKKLENSKDKKDTQRSNTLEKTYDSKDDPYSCKVPLESHKNQPERNDFQVLLDYKCLVAGKRELEVIETVGVCKYDQLQQIFFLHPLVKSFLLLKWRRVDFIFTILSFIYIVHVSSITGLALLFRDHQTTLLYWVCRCGIWMTIIPVIFMEVINWMLNGKIYSETEVYTKWAAMLTTVVLSVVSDVWWGRYLASLTILLAWVELLLFYAMSPSWGLYILMFFEVATNVFQVLSSFIFLFVGFALSFYVLLDGQQPFTDIWSSFCEVLAMMSELGYNDIFNEDYADNEPFKIFGRVMYLLFLFLVIMVLTNIILGMSVGDVTQLEGKSKHLAKQGSFLSLMDKFCYNKKILLWLPRHIQNQIKKNFHPPLNNCIVYPNRPTSERNPLQKELLYEIMTIVSERKSHTEDINSLAKKLQLTRKKVDEIYQQGLDIKKRMGI